MPGVTSLSVLFLLLALCPMDVAGYKACNPNPCKNDGQCVYYWVSFGSHCICPSGYSGRNCEIDIDDCASDPCGTNLTCQDQVNGYTCSCVDGFKGESGYIGPPDDLEAIFGVVDTKVIYKLDLVTKNLTPLFSTTETVSVLEYNTDTGKIYWCKFGSPWCYVQDSPESSPRPLFQASSYMYDIYLDSSTQQIFLMDLEYYLYVVGTDGSGLRILTSDVKMFTLDKANRRILYNTFEHPSVINIMCYDGSALDVKNTSLPNIESLSWNPADSLLYTVVYNAGLRDQGDIVALSLENMDQRTAMTNSFLRRGRRLVAYGDVVLFAVDDHPDKRLYVGRMDGTNLTELRIQAMSELWRPILRKKKIDSLDSTTG